MSQKLDPIYVIKRPLLSEKSTWDMNELSRYSFEVAKEASKKEIKDAVEKIYRVRVEGVNVQVKKGKMRRHRFGLAWESDVKKATVRLHKDDKIELF
jgi:large subunit ribosomal protein L23